MKRRIALLCILVVLVPSVVPATVIQTLFPPSAQFFAEIVTSGSLDGINHQFLGINLTNLDLYALQMGASGVPFAASGFPWLYGKIVQVQQIGPSTFRVFWDISVSTGGLSGIFTPVGVISIDITV